MKKDIDGKDVRLGFTDHLQDDELTIDSIRGSPLNICTVEEIVDDDHVIVSSQGILEYLVGVASIVDRDLLEPGCSVLVNPLVCIFNSIR